MNSSYITFGAPLATMVLWLAWTLYLKGLQRATNKSIQKFCNESKAKVIAEQFTHNPKSKKYTVYTHQANTPLQLGEGKEVTLLGFSLLQALKSYYSELRKQHATVQFKPIAVISIQENP